MQSWLASGNDDSIKKAPAFPDKIKKALLIQEGIAGVMDEVWIVTVGAAEITSRNKTHAAYFAGEIYERSLL
ncbi:MAG: hypothetical protein A2170_15915 [Deltaproteobacteria bacterium RBG_13_53_10]|nr:MAG: hypothetical protein A2170_15915 [Deltaproteobacteria bacterium RBG_13_53_10]